MSPPTTARQPFNRKHFLLVAVTEGTALTTAALRIALSNGAIGLSAPAHLAWFLTTVGLAVAGLVQFSIRSSLLRQKDLRGEETTEARKGVLATALAFEAGAFVLALVGPSPFNALFAS